LVNLIYQAAELYIEKNGQNLNTLSEHIYTKISGTSRLVDGLVIKKKSHFSFKGQYKEAEILLIEGAFEPDPISSEAASTDEGVKRLEQNVSKLLDLSKAISKAGIQAVFTSSSLFPMAEELLAKEGVFVLTHLRKEDLKTLAWLSGASPVSRASLLDTNAKDLFKSISGKLTSINHDAELDAFVFQGTEKYFVSIAIANATLSVAEENRRIASDAAKVLAKSLDSGYLLGEGVAELNLQKELKRFKQDWQEEADIYYGVEVIEKSLAVVFKQILENAGFDSIAAIEKLNPQINNKLGINLDNGEAIDLEEQGIIDSVAVKVSAFKIALEFCSQILRINTIVQAKH